MCGISGVYRLVGNGPNNDTEIVRAMNARLVQRGPDDEGVYHDGDVTLGNRRLAILDLSSEGHQPMESRSGRFVITFNGEIYNHRDVAEELGLDHGQLRSRTDTEVLLNAWERWGPDALDRLVGQWAFAVFDREERILWLARDRFGEKPLYYHEGGGTLTFASTIPALFAAPWVPRELDPDAIHEYLTIRYVVAPRTAIAGVRKLPPAHFMRVDSSGVRIHEWYTLRFRRKRRLAFRGTGELVEEFGELFGRASRRCLVSDVPVALLLSDGIDSNSIRCALKEQGEDVPAYTFTAVSDEGAPDPGGTRPDRAEEIRVKASDRIEHMVPAFSSLTEPVGDGASLATWLLIRGAREHATVFLCGHGSDEIVGGYRLGYDRSRLFFLNTIAWVPAEWVHGKVEKYLHGNEPFSERWRRLRWSPLAKSPDVARHLIHRPLPPADLREMYRSATGPDGYLETIDRLYAGSRGTAALDRMQEVLIRTFLSTNILSWADSVAMDSSAELRMPYLDRDLVDFVLSLPPRLRVRWMPGRTGTKVILRRWGNGRLDEGVLRRGKRGFPFGSLPDLLRTDGDTLRSRILDASPLRRLLPGLEDWLGHPPAYFRDPWEGILWSLLALAIWSDQAGIR